MPELPKSMFGRTPVVSPEVRCRQISTPDLDSIADLLTAGFPRQPRSHWLNAFKLLSDRVVPEGFPRYGYMLHAGTTPVGVILLIFSQETNSGTLRCNGSAWYVLPSFRTFAPLLLKKILMHKAIHINVWPAIQTLPIIEALGYKRFCNGIFAAVPLLAAQTYMQKTKITRAVRAIHNFVPAGDLQILRDHETFGCFSLWCETQGKGYPFIFRRRFVKQLALTPVAQLIYCNCIGDVVRFAGPIGKYLALRGMPLMVIPANGPVPKLSGKYFGDRTMYYHGPEPPRLGDLAYTEVAMFGV
jgi:hypothetical protein